MCVCMLFALSGWCYLAALLFHVKRLRESLLEHFGKRRRRRLKLEKKIQVSFILPPHIIPALKGPCTAQQLGFQDGEMDKQ